ncbi:MAG: carbohydrate porin [Planctomycetota bacterium]|nr:carbohydrate porin [Planctomycetota bacterium]
MQTQQDGIKRLSIVAGLAVVLVGAARTSAQPELANVAEAEAEMNPTPPSVERTPRRVKPEATPKAPSQQTPVERAPASPTPPGQTATPTPPATDPATPAAPLADPGEREWFGGLPIYRWSRATGDWGGARTWLEDRGIEFAASYTLDWSSVWDGGLVNEASTRTQFDANVTFDLETMVGLEGASVYLDFYSTDSRGGWEYVGDFQGTSNIQTGTNRDQIAELWFEQKAFDDRLRVKVGKIDANLEFGFPEIAGDFINSAAAYSPTSYRYMPTFPDPATGAVVFMHPTENVYVGGGFFDGAFATGRGTGYLGPDSLFEGNQFFWINEAGITWDPGDGASQSLGTGRIAAGWFYNSGDLERLDGSTEEGTGGLYAIAEQQLTRVGLDGVAPSDGEDPRGLHVFLQFGTADGGLSPAERHFAVGSVLKGMPLGRTYDSSGVYLTWADMSAEAGATENERTLEFYYRIEITPFIHLTPDIQYVINPSGAEDVDNALVGALRLEVAF